MEKSKFYVCEHCGNIIGMINDAGVNVVCCGQKMTNLIPGTTDASREKHLPVVTVSANTVKVSVGSVTHPMTSEHNISWIYLETNMGGQRKVLLADGEPIALFALSEGEYAVAAYAFCNLHGLWKTEI